MDELRAAVGDQGMQTAFWTMLGSLVLSNIGLVIGAVISHIKKIEKLRTDLNEAFKEIRFLKKELQKNKGENL